MFESVAKRSLWNGRVEIVYISSSQVVVKSVVEENGPTFNPVVIRTQPALEIESVRIMGHENYAVARTDRTLIVADLRRGLVSEVPWKEADNVKIKRGLLLKIPILQLLLNDNVGYEFDEVSLRHTPRLYDILQR